MRTIKWAVAAIVVIAIVLGSIFYWRHAQRYPSTDDAYIGAHVVHPAPEVSGEVAVVAVKDNQHVNKGALLYQLDAVPFKLAVKQAKAKLSQARTNDATLHASVAAAKAQVANRKAQLEEAKLDAKRTQNLVGKGYRTKAQGTHANATLKGAEAAMALAKAHLNKAVEELGEAGQTNSSVVMAKANLSLAKWRLSHSVVKAPCNGTVAALKLRPGDNVAAGRAPFVLVCNARVWVDANYKETQLTGINRGDTATVVVDMYPDKVFHGRVVGINPASGTAFSLLPPENATGNWVKVTQRVPVRVLITDADAAHPLRVGTSAEVTIDTQSSSAQHAAVQ